MISGAVFSDLDGDGAPELILACEWGPIRIFRNEHGKLTPWDPPVAFSSAPAHPERETRNVPAAPKPGEGGKLGTLSQLTGWWNGVTTGDLDGDGRLDIIASNWGLNSRYRTTREHPRRIFFGDFDGNGTVDLIEAYFDEQMGKEVPERTLKSLDHPSRSWAIEPGRATGAAPGS